MSTETLNKVFADSHPDFDSGDATPTQILASKIDTLELTLDVERKRKEEMRRAMDGLKCALKDTMRDLETALGLIPNHDHPFHFQLQSRIEHIKLLLAAKKLDRTNGN